MRGLIPKSSSSVHIIEEPFNGAGYVIGLGDRHSQNILIDGATAAVVHIDLGIAFEQGRFLMTPELVPFRLTRDIVDGMGATGACRGVPVASTPSPK